MELKKETLEKVINSLYEIANEERRNSDAYKHMFEKSQFGLRGLIDEFIDETNNRLLTLVTVIEDRTGKRINNNIYEFLQAAPLVFDEVKKDISKKEGYCCCCDKAREIVYKYILENLKDK